jgi:hypothetical protein
MVFSEFYHICREHWQIGLLAKSVAAAELSKH